MPIVMNAQNWSVPTRLLN